MGALLSILRSSPAGGGNSGSSTGRSPKDAESSARFSKQFNAFILNLGDDYNTQYIEANFGEGYALLVTGQRLLQEIRRYQDSSEEIRVAISQPSSESEKAAWRKLAPSVSLLRECFEYSQAVDRIVPDILDELCSQVNDYDLGKTDRNRGLARLLADLMQDAFAFDMLKASFPGIQNDFSYYRRTLSRMSNCQDPAITGNIVPQDVSNHMSLFYAYHNPMVRTVVDSASRFARESHNEALVLECISALAAGSFNTVTRHKADSKKSEQLCMLVLVTCYILYDWISPQGVNNTQFAIDSKSVLGLAKQHHLVEETSAYIVLCANCKTPLR